MTILNYCSRWESGRLATIFAENTDKNTLLSFTDALQFRYGEIRPKPTYELTDDLKETYRKYALVRPNDIMLNGLNLNYDFVTQRVAQVKVNGIITSAYISLRPREGVSAQYYTYLFKSLDAMKVFNGMGTGIRLTLSYNLLKNLELPVPPRAEQEQIVRYLDWQVSKINKLIAAKKKQIATLKTALQEEIEGLLYGHSIVETVRLKALGKFSKGGGFSRINLVEEANYPAILYGDIYTQYIYKTDVITHFIDKDAYKASRKISKGDIVLAGTGETKDEIGKPILYSGDDAVAVGGDVIVFHPNNEVNSEYILYQLYSQAALIHRYIHGKGDIIVHISPAMLGNTVLKLPSEKEQKSTVTKIDTAVNRVSATVKTISDEIGVLNEYRTRLISDVVTGQMDVRGIEVPDFEMVEDIGIDDTLNEDEIPEEAEEQEE